MSEAKQFKQLPIGDDDFQSLIAGGHYYVDKTPFLRTVFKENGNAVLLITRPRRFGKTMLLSMFDQFLGMSPQGPGDLEDLNRRRKLFDGLEIMRDHAFVEEYMGRFPVIFISLKTVYGKSYGEAYKCLASLMSDLAQKLNAYLSSSPNLSEAEKRKVAMLATDGYLKDQGNIDDLRKSLQFLGYCMFRHFCRKVVLLVDEYDVPLAKAAAGGYHEEMVNLIGGFFELLKTNPSGSSVQSGGDKFLQKVVMTGCLKVAKNSIFTGVNNLKTKTVLTKDPDFSTIIGFTKGEVSRILEDYELLDYSDTVRENYDGYRFFKDEIFCPWDVLNFVEDNYRHHLRGDPESISADNYWIGSSSDPALQGYMGFLTENDNDRMQELLDGGSIEIQVNDSMNYDDLQKRCPADFWSLLLHTGYLTALKELPDSRYVAAIPNLEIMKCFRDNVQKHFSEHLQSGERNLAKDLADFMLKGDVPSVEDLLFRLLQNYVSVRDAATRAAPENFYHGMLLGILGSSGKTIRALKSNPESGRGYADITFTDARGRTGVVTEIKVAGKNPLSTAARNALSQIERRQYADNFLKDPDLDHVLAYAMVFSGKECRIEMKHLR